MNKICRAECIKVKSVRGEYKDKALPFVGHADLQTTKGIQVRSLKFGASFGIFNKICRRHKKINLASLLALRNYRNHKQKAETHSEVM